jgi:hypothetical protein
MVRVSRRAAAEDRPEDGEQDREAGGRLGAPRLGAARLAVTTGLRGAG